MAKPSKKTRDYSGNGRSGATFLSPPYKKRVGDDAPFYRPFEHGQPASKRKAKKSPARRKKK